MEINIGKKIKALRLASDLTQEELANRAELTAGFISQIESEKFQTSISIDSLSDILDVLGVSLAEFFSESNGPRVVYKPTDRVPIEGSGASSFELLIPGSTNTMMDPAVVELQPGEAIEERDPHPGEQFGFVLRGTITLVLGKKEYRIPKSGCFYFRADKQHQVLNNSGKAASFLWVIAPPQM